jgi:hypothetical protein
VSTDAEGNAPLSLPADWPNANAIPSTIYLHGTTDAQNPPPQKGTLALTLELELQDDAQTAPFSDQPSPRKSWHKIVEMIGVSLLPVDITARKQGTTKAPDDGLLVKKGDVIEFALAPQFFDTEDNFESLITWQQRQLKGDGTYTEWANISALATGTKFEHTTAAGGIFQIKAIITNGDEHEYKRKKDAPHATNGSKVYNEKLRKDQPDFIGVADNDAQISMRNQSLSSLGSTAYAKSAAITVGYGVDPTLTFKRRWKCNIFVFKMANAAGATVPTRIWPDKVPAFGIPPWTIFNRPVPPGANEWYTLSYGIPAWTWSGPASLPQPGYAAIHQHIDAAVGGAAHMGVLDYDGTWINAGEFTVNKSIHVSDSSYQPTNYRKP